MFGLFYQLAAPAAAANKGASTPSSGLMSFLPIILMVVFMYLLVIMPENKRRKKLQKQIASLQQGDRVITVGNVVGTVDFIGEKTVYLKTLDTKIEVAKSGISSIIDDSKG